MSKKDQEVNFKGLLQKAFDSHDGAAFMHIPILEQQLKDDPNNAINLIHQTFEAALNQAYTNDGENQRAFVESLARGPMETIPWAVYNAVGGVYLYLEKNQRFAALRQVLRCLDKYNTKIVQDTHTCGIRDPILLTDIAIVRPPYWPGLDEGWAKIKNFSSFNELEKEMIDDEGMFKKTKVRSDFIMAWTLLCSQWSPWGEDYVKIANPKFLERILKGLVNYCFSNRSTAESINSELQNFKANLPQSTYHRIEPLTKEKDWPNFEDFK